MLKPKICAKRITACQAKLSMLTFKPYLKKTKKEVGQMINPMPKEIMFALDDLHYDETELADIVPDREAFNEVIRHMAVGYGFGNEDAMKIFATSACMMIFEGLQNINKTTVKPLNNQLIEVKP
jgi:hypothetical protein